MITAYTATPVRFDSFDFSKIGNGTGIARHGHGMYFGSTDVAKHYLDTYKHYTEADKTHYFQGKPIASGTLPFDVAEHYSINGYDSTLEKFSNSDLGKKYLNILFDGDSPQFHSEGGVLYCVNIPHFTEKDLRDWDDNLDSDDLIDIFHKFTNKYLLIDSLGDEMKAKLEELNIDTNDTDAETVIDNLLEAAFDEYGERVEEEGEDYELNAYSHGDLLDTWIHRAFDDYDYNPDNDDSDNDIRLLDSRFANALTELCKNAPNFHHDEFSLGDMLIALRHSLSALKPEMSEIEVSQEVSLFAARELEIIGYTAPAIAGEQCSKEIVIIDERVLENAKKIEVSKYLNEDLDTTNDLDF